MQMHFAYKVFHAQIYTIVLGGEHGFFRLYKGIEKLEGFVSIANARGVPDIIETCGCKDAGELSKLPKNDWN